MKRILPKAALLTVVCICLLAAGFALPAHFGAHGEAARQPAFSTDAGTSRTDGAAEEPELAAPLAAPVEAPTPEVHSSPGWAVLNLLLGLAGVALACVAAFGALRRGSATNTAPLVLWRLATILAGVGALAIFLFSSSFGGGFAIANQWTWLTAFLVVFQILGLLMLNRQARARAAVALPTEE